MPVNGLYKPAIWPVCDYWRFRIGRKTVVSWASFSRKCPLPMIISADNSMKSGIPAIRDQMERLRPPIKNSSKSSEIAIIKINISTLKTPRKERIVSHICSESCASSGLSRAVSRSTKEPLDMNNSDISSNKVLTEVYGTKTSFF
jgi:hypothetical protein